MMAPPAKLFSVRLFPCLCLIAWTSLNAVLVDGIRILECNGGNIEIREDNNPVNSLTCEGFTATQMIQWTLYSDGAEQAVIRCGTNNLPCNPSYPGITVTRPNSTHSVLVLETLHRVRLGNGGYINCRVEGTTVGTSCNTRVIGVVDGLQIPECIGGSIDIREDNNPVNSITCEGFTAIQGIRWTLYSDGAEQASITCGTTVQTCSHLYPGITVTRPNSTYSVLVLETLHRARLGNGYIGCRADGQGLGTSCNTRVIEFVNGIRIPECIGGNIDIREDNNPVNSITCEGFTASQVIKWTLNSDGAEQAVIRCGNNDLACNPPYPGITVTRPNSTHSVLVLETLHRVRLGNGYIDCRVDGTTYRVTCNTLVIASSATSAQTTPTSATTSPGMVRTKSPTTFQQVSSVTTPPGPPTSSIETGDSVTETPPFLPSLPVTSPPPSSLTLSGFNPDTELSEGDRVSLTCTVTDGVPPVSSLTVLCGRHSNTCFTQSGEEETTVSCNLVVAAITTENDGVICVCFADWQDRPDAYSLSDRVTLRVRTRVDKSSNTAAYIGVGVTAALVLIAAIVVGALLYWRYRRRTVYDRPQPRRQEDPYTDLVVYESVGQPSQTQQHDQKSSRPAVAADTKTAEYENTKTGTALQAS